MKWEPCLLSCQKKSSSLLCLAHATHLGRVNAEEGCLSSFMEWMSYPWGSKSRFQSVASKHSWRVILASCDHLVTDCCWMMGWNVGVRGTRLLSVLQVTWRKWQLVAQCWAPKSPLQIIYVGLYTWPVVFWSTGDGLVDMLSSYQLTILLLIDLTITGVTFSHRCGCIFLCNVRYCS